MNDWPGPGLEGLRGTLNAFAPKGSVISRFGGTPVTFAPAATGVLDVADAFLASPAKAAPENAMAATADTMKMHFRMLFPFSLN